MSKKKHEWTRKGVTASMAVVLAFGMVPAVPGVALATDDGVESEPSVESNQPVTSFEKYAKTSSLAEGSSYQEALTGEDISPLTADSDGSYGYVYSGNKDTSDWIYGEFNDLFNEWTDRAIVSQQVYINPGDFAEDGDGFMLMPTVNEQRGEKAECLVQFMTYVKKVGDSVKVDMYTTTSNWGWLDTGREVAELSDDDAGWYTFVWEFSYDEVDRQVDCSFSLTKDGAGDACFKTSRSSQALQEGNGAESLHSVAAPSFLLCGSSGQVNVKFKPAEKFLSYSEYLVSSTAGMQAAIDDAEDGDFIRMEAGTYEGNIHFAGKSLNIVGSNAWIAPDSAYRVEPTVFTGTMSTSYEPMCNTDPQSAKPYDSTFNAGQRITIDGIDFKGDGLKIGDNNYNSVGELSVSNCTFTPGNDLESDTQHSTDNEHFRDWAQNQYNYFVKVCNDPSKGFVADVSLYNNKVVNNPESSTVAYPVALWSVDNVQVFDNVFDFEGSSTAVNISKVSKDANISVWNNVFEGVDRAVYMTTWAVPDDSFTGAVHLTDNSVTGASEQPFFIGHKEETDKSFDGNVYEAGNSLNGSPVLAEIGKTENEGRQFVSMTIDGGNGWVERTTYSMGENEALSCSLPDAPTKTGYAFVGWDVNGEVLNPGEMVSVQGDVKATAVWSAIPAPPAGGGSVEEPEGEVTENEDGSTTTTVTEDDGSSVETTVSEDEGVTTVVEKDGDGAVTSVSATVTEAAVESAAGKAVALPFAEPIEAASSDEAVEIEVQAPAGAKVAVPVAKAEGASSVAPGAVLVLVDAEGNETVLPKTANDGSSLSAEIPGDCTLKVVDASASFPDVASGDWYAEQGVADFVSARGVMTGVEVAPGSFEFQGDEPTNRGMFVTMLHRLESEPAAASDGFADVPEDSWYEDSSAWAVEAGIATGYLDAEGNATFDGEGKVTREQMATFLFRYAEWLGLDTSARAEQEIEGVSDFAKDAVSWAVAEGLIKGDDGTGAIRPTDGATRAEAAAVVMRMIDLMA